MKASPLFRIGLVSALIYALNAIHYGWTPALRNSVDDALAWFTVILLLVLYWAGYRQLSRLAPAGFRSVILPLLPSLLFVSVTTPYDSTDAFQYLAIGWAQSHYGMNPYTGGLRQIPGIEADPGHLADHDLQRAEKG